MGDIWQTNVVVPRGGFLSCFHQSDEGPISQILPIQPNASFEVGEGQEISVPNPANNFDIKFEHKGVPEKIMCILEVSKTPIDNSSFRAKDALAPGCAIRFNHSIKTYRKINPRKGLAIYKILKEIGITLGCKAINRQCRPHPMWCMMGFCWWA